MKELEVIFNDYYPDIIYFKANFCWHKTYFLINKNFKTTKSLSTSSCDVFNLKHNLDLKQFKIEII